MTSRMFTSDDRQDDLQCDGFSLGDSWCYDQFEVFKITKNFISWGTSLRLRVRLQEVKYPTNLVLCPTRVQVRQDTARTRW